MVLKGNRTISDFNMSPVGAILDVLLVSEQIPATHESEGGLAIRSVDPEDEVGSAASDLLKDVPGVLISQPSGQVGSGIKIRLRGVRSMFAGNEPLVYVDGVRTTSSSSALPWVSGESALDFIPSSQIERIEVFKGPAAAARFGTGAMPGVILIFTKKGPPLKPH